MMNQDAGACKGMPVEYPFRALLFLVIVSWAFSCAGLILGIFAESWDNIATMVNFFITPLIFLGGVFYSIDMLPGFWKNLSMANPIYYVINGLRYSVLGVSDSPFWISMTVALAMTVLFTAIGIFLFQRGYRIKQ